MSVNKLPPRIKYELFKRALDSGDFLEAETLYQHYKCNDLKLDELVSREERLRVLRGIRKGFEEGRYDYE